jgi:hypothetical protein
MAIGYGLMAMGLVVNGYIKGKGGPPFRGPRPSRPREIVEMAYF